MTESNSILSALPNTCERGVNMARAKVKADESEKKTAKSKTKGTRTVAKELGVHRETIKRARKELGIEADELEQNIGEIKDYVSGHLDIRKRNDEIVKTMTDNIGELKIDVRRIDKSEGSSLSAMLQDCKERYVANEKIIQRLQFEIDSQTVLTLTNTNSTLSAFPQLNSIERIQKLNISLRNQIVQLEQLLGKTANNTEGNNPFE